MKCLNAIITMLIFFNILIYNISSRKIRGSNLKKFKNFQNGDEEIKKFETILLEENKPLKNYGAVYLNDKGQFVLSANKKEDKSMTLVGECFFSKVINEKGWDKFSISTYKAANPYQQAYIAGYLEGRMTSNDIYNFYNNLRVNNMKKHKYEFKSMLEFFEQVGKSFTDRINEIKAKTDTLSYEDKKYWSRLILGFTQLEGLISGYNYEMARLNKSDKFLSLADFLALQADGEIPELIRYFNSRNKKTKMGDKDYFKSAFGINTNDPLEFWGQLMWTSKCSAFIKLTKDDKGNWADLLSGHTTWTEYYEMLRSYKHYKFELSDKGVFYNSEITFSSYPGCISSTDDFYLTNHNLLVMETTLEVIDIHLYDNIKPANQYIPNFARVLAATRFSKSAEEWVEYFSKNSSGTYSSQWMIVDYNVFNQIKNKNTRPDKLIYMMEQTPQGIIAHDISNYLYDHSYFGSFNRAFLEETKNSLHMAMIKHLYGEKFGYRGSSRGRIFKNLQNSVKDLKSLKDILRYNGYMKAGFKDDPSAKNPGVGISARYDLRGLNKNLSGGIDCKVTNNNLAKQLTSIAISGPTNENNPNLLSFDWNKITDKSISREGVPLHYNFPYILMSPTTICCDNKSDIYTFK